MSKEELKQRIEDNHNHFKEVAENYVNECWGSYLDLDYVDLVLAGIGVGKIIALEEETRIAELEKKIEILEGQSSLHEGILWNDLHRLEEENAKLEAFKEKSKFNISDVFKDIETENNLIKAKGIIKILLHKLIMAKAPYKTDLTENEIAEIKKFIGDEVEK